MKKSITLLILVLVGIFSLSNEVYASNFNIGLNGQQLSVPPVNVKLNGTNLQSEFPAFIMNDRTLVPVRVISEYFNSKVDWDQNSKMVTITRGNDTVMLVIDSAVAIKNNNRVNVNQDSIPRLVAYYGTEGKTVVPLRLLTELLGYTVNWDQGTKTASISQGEQTATTVPTSAPAGNQITGIKIVNGSTKNEQIQITSNTAIKYKSDYDQDGNAIFLEFEGATFNIAGRNSGHMDFDSTLISGIDYISDTNGKFSRMAIQLHQNVFAKYKTLNSNKTLNISFTNKVTSIRSVDYQGQPAILVSGVKTSEYNILKLQNPFRYIIDIKDASFYSEKSFESLNISMDFIKGIRASQFVPDKNYNSNDNIVRIVLDGKDGFTDAKVSVVKVGDDLIIVPNGGSAGSTVVTSPILDPNTGMVTTPTIPEYVPVIRPRPPVNSRADVKIVIDPGHGGRDPGAKTESGLLEKDFNLNVALKVRDLLRNDGYTVKMTRDTDRTLDIYSRPEFANNELAHLFISIHANMSLNLDAKGIEVLYAPRDTVLIKSDEQWPLANELLAQLVSRTGMINRGTRKRSDLIVLKNTEMVAALVECGFMSNVEELEILKTEAHKQNCADAIYGGIKKYISDTYGY